MSVIATALRELMAAGVSGEALIAAVERIEAAQASVQAPTRTARQDRNARYYENRKARLEASETVLIQAPKTVSDANSDAEAAGQKEGPQTPKKNYSPSESTASADEKPSKRKKPKGTLCPEDFQPSETHRAKCRARGVPESLADTTCRKLLNWSHANADRDIAWKADWSRALHGMLDDDIERHLRQQAGSRASPNGTKPTSNGPLSRVADLLGIPDDQRSRGLHRQPDHGPVIDHEGDGRPHGQVHESSGGQAGRFSAEAHLRLISAGGR